MRGGTVGSYDQSVVYLWVRGSWRMLQSWGARVRPVPATCTVPLP